jgi:hypothetical protein
MAFSGREKTFKLENCRDLYNKLQREIDRFNADPTDLHARVDHAFNVVVTAWHLCDWVYADLTAAQKTNLQIKSLDDLKARTLQCRALHLCRQAAIASKHWAVETHPDPDVSTVVSIAPIRKHEDLYGPTRFELYFKDGDEHVAAEKVFDAVLEFWTQFIYQNQIAANDPP